MCNIFAGATMEQQYHKTKFVIKKGQILVYLGYIQGSLKMKPSYQQANLKFLEWENVQKKSKNKRK